MDLFLVIDSCLAIWGLCVKPLKQMRVTDCYLIKADNWLVFNFGTYRMVFVSESEPTESDQCIPMAICHVLAVGSVSGESLLSLWTEKIKDKQGGQ